MIYNFPVLRQYQTEIAKAVIDSILGKKGLTFSVEIARQGGKNELSAQIELFLLMFFTDKTRNLIKCSPTFKPQTVISMLRLMDRLNAAGLNGLWTPERGYIIRLDNTRAIFLSADKSSNVVGNTAHLLLEVDESQDVDKDKYSKEFKPMGATTNCTTVHYGTTWDEMTLLEEIKQTNLEMEKRDGTRRHFHYDWQEIAKHNPDYLAYVEAEKQRLGEGHPLFLTQYRLLPVHSGGGFFNLQQISQLTGSHPRKRQMEAGKLYVAGIDLAGEAEEDRGNNQDTRYNDLTNSNYQNSKNTGGCERDATVVTVGELDFSVCDDIRKQPRVLIVEHYR
jgi:hypothetical protein